MQEMKSALRARVGIVLLDEFYLSKKWTVWELREMMQLLTSGEVRLLPVLYSMTFQQLSDQLEKLSAADSSSVRGANKDDAEMLAKLERITMIHSNTAKMVSSPCTCIVLSVNFC